MEWLGFLSASAPEKRNELGELDFVDSTVETGPVAVMRGNRGMAAGKRTGSFFSSASFGWARRVEGLYVIFPRFGGVVSGGEMTRAGFPASIHRCNDSYSGVLGESRVT